MANPTRDFVLRLSTGSGRPELGSATPNDGQMTEELHRWLKPGMEIILIFDRYVARTAIMWLAESSSDARIEGCVRLLGVSARADSDCPETSEPSE